MIDLRSDTVTRPSAAMRRAMADADVGDDVYGEDPTARALEEEVAALLGKESALFVPSGTMANQIALMIHCRPGDEVVCGRGAHLFYYEGGAGGAWAGVQFLEVGETGLFTAADMLAARKAEVYWLARTRLVALENTHNRSGGRLFPQADADAIGEAARKHGMGVHLDGARIWNAAAASGRPLAELCRSADTVSVCFSKGLGAPVGSILAGSRDHIAHGRRLRRMMGGAMRQVGMLCAGARYALAHNLGRLSEDHDNAKALAAGLGKIPGIVCDPASVESNIVNFDVRSMPAEAVVSRAAAAGVLVGALSASRIRAVTHLDVTPAHIAEAVRVFDRALA